ncbi:MAG: PIN domain-containing protein [Oscillospiraceae bacterium]
MNCFLIDFENVRSNGLKGIEHLKNIDDVCIFYSDYANSITFDIHHSMNKSSANISFFKSTKTGKNALDFQLVSYLGYLIAQKKYKNYYVITGDRGFESAISFWKDFFKNNNMSYLNIGRFYTIKEAIDTKGFPSKTIKDTLPTIPTVETELELRQLKAESVIVDVNSKKVENQFESSLNKNNGVEKSVVDDNAFKGSSKQVKGNNSNSSHMESIPKSSGSLSPVTKKDTPKSSVNKLNEDKKSQPQNNVKSLQTKDENKSKNKNKNQNTGNNKINNNPNKNSNNSLKKTNNNDNTLNKNLNNKLPKDSINDNISKSNYNAPVKLPSQTQRSNTMVFGKINPNDDIATIEKFEKKTSQPPISQKKQEPTKKFSPKSKKDSQEPLTQEVKTIPSISVDTKIIETIPKVEKVPTPKDDGNIVKELVSKPVVEEVKTISKVETSTKAKENAPKVEKVPTSKDNIDTVKELVSKPVIEEVKIISKEETSIETEENTPKVEKTPTPKDNVNTVKELVSKPVIREVKIISEEETSIETEENAPKVEKTPTPKDNFDTVKELVSKSVVEEVKTISKVETSTEAKENAPKVEKVPTPKDNVDTIKELVSKPTVDEKSKLKVDAKLEKSSTVVKRRGRPRTKSIEENKPKNNKKYNNEIPKEKLSKMLDQLSKLINVSDYSQEDLINICKLIAFGTKNETYRTLMSLLGKEKTLKIFKVIKQEFDNLKKLYEN